ncbi:NADH-quinone oxidoreductase subunit NuoE [Shewanella eurypsychrophilus]|uniref:NADH-quinone oxidoreductase subunit E n=1 Tax=Shewanella eurypsychrophilus TaxID=2593656 RepID=A0ABX6V9N1_9GAMM|nr:MULTISPECIES: NADH-quinone oxidoreductase subunit NuoE [Shewanella]QFU23311.1 NADH-quinone oxidoreductase subunit NuoE [Shewanella sp. YLB-09]QPG58540.1 NADH-quinone oxidoreductase subunit NuoE [Shewanella eurypsychrophilus]
MTRGYEQQLRIPIQELISADTTRCSKYPGNSGTSSTPVNVTTPKLDSTQERTDTVQTATRDENTHTSNLVRSENDQDRLDADQLSQCEKAQLDKLLKLAPCPAGVSIDALKVIQEARGWVSDTSLSLLSSYLNVSISDLDSVATFYNLIFRRPVGDIVLHPCNGISCDLMGGAEIRNTISQQLNIKPGETTADNQFTLIPLPCLGACDKAPVMIASKRLYENLDSTQTLGLIDALIKGNK